MKNKVTAVMRRKLSKIKLVAMDVDGVLTDAGMYYTSKGEVMKKFNAKDGKAIEMLRDMGMKVAFITGEDSLIVKARAKKLKIKNLYLCCKEKVKAAQALLSEHRLKFENMLYVGDDWGDIELLKRTGFSCAPRDASQSAIDCANYVCTRNGGEGVMAEVVSVLIKASCGKPKRTY